MSVVAFERKQDTGEWSERELSTLVAALALRWRRGPAANGKPA